METNYIKDVIESEFGVLNISEHELSRRTGIASQRINDFFKEGRAKMEVANALMAHFNLKIVKVYEPGKIDKPRKFKNKVKINTKKDTSN